MTSYSVAICSIEGCSRKPVARGLCTAHYQRWWKYGDPTGGSTSPGAPAAFLDRALSAETDDCILWPFATNIHGYGAINIGGSMRGTHRVVCEKAHGPAPTPMHEAAHDNGGRPCKSRACINPRHLSWKTLPENKADELSHGTRNRGDRNGKSKLIGEVVLEIRAMQGKLPQSEIAAMFGISRTAVSEIHRRKKWAWLDKALSQNGEDT